MSRGHSDAKQPVCFGRFWHAGTIWLIVKLMKDSPQPELEFPLDCSYRIIAENREHMHFVIETVLLQLGVHSPLVKNHESSKGRYVSFAVDVRVPSREMMDRIDRELRLIEGVRTVL